MSKRIASHSFEVVSIECGSRDGDRRLHIDVVRIPQASVLYASVASKSGGVGAPSFVALSSGTADRSAAAHDVNSR